MYVRKISQEVDSEVPYHYSSWKNVDAKYKKAILATIAHYFDIKSFQNTEHWDAIKESIQVECASRFKDRKSGMKKHFDRHGGYKDVEEAKRHPPESMDPEAWCKLIDGLFTTPEYMNRSEKNKANRAKQLYGSYHGSQSLANRRHKEVKETGRARYVEGWKEMHCKKGKWINDNAKHAWENIEEEYNRSLSCSGGDEMAVDQVGCLKNALGTRHSHLRGVGRVLKSVTPELFANVNRDVEDERWRRQEEANEKLRKDNEALKAQMKHILKLVLPGSSFPLEEEDDQEEEQEDDDFV
ncbi:putative transposase, Ptta/En/Spm, plant [Helianthus debilis subsp. tardiflorus]